MLLSVDVARELARDRLEIIEQNQFGFRDDVTIGHWIDTRMSNARWQATARDTRTRDPIEPDHLFLPHPDTSVDYVMKAADTHRPVEGAFHYHFHSLKPKDMVNFHQRHFAKTAI